MVWRRSGGFLLGHRKLKNAPTAILDDVERTLLNVEQDFGNGLDIRELLPQHRELVSIARNLGKRLLPYVNCRQCWLKPAHCICDKLHPVESLPFEKIFVLMHHNEVGLALDTAKIIFATFPETSRLVVGGIPSKYQGTMKELEDTISNGNCVVLFPKDGAPLGAELFMSNKNETAWPDVSKFPNLIVIDGTWEQARRLHSKYIPDTIQHVQLNLDNNKLDEVGRQLRHHPIPFRQIATVHALLLLAEDMGISLPLREYQALAKTAARAHLVHNRRNMSLVQN